MTRARGILVAALLAALACALGGVPLHRAPRTVAAPRKQALEAELGGREAAKPYIRSRLVGWPTHLLVDRGSLPADDAAFLKRLARDTWRGLEALSDRENGFPLDHVRFDDSLDPARAKIGDYASSASLGLYLVSVVAAH